MDNNSNVSNNKGNGRELFYIVITIAIFIVMAVGATFAFFTATASSGSADVGTRSATLSLEYISYGSAWARDDLSREPALLRIQTWLPLLLQVLRHRPCRMQLRTLQQVL